MNPKPLPGIIRTPCMKCKGERKHLGIGVCWDCMGPAERERLAHDEAPAATEEIPGGHAD